MRPKEPGPGPGGVERWALRLLAALLPPPARDAELGDLEERYRETAERAGRRTARRWLLGQVLRSVGPGVAMRWRARRDESTRTEGGMGMDRIRMDLRFALRSLRKSPGFAALAVTTLGMAMAVTTAIFSLVSGVFLVDLPIADPDRTAFVWAVHQDAPGVAQELTAADYLDLTTDLASAERVGAMEAVNWVLTGLGDPERVVGARVTPGFFEVWGVAPFRGRGLTEADLAPGAPPVVLVSHGFWERALGGDPDVLGRTLTLDGTPHTVVGVVSPSMEFGGLDAELWGPLRLRAAGASRTAHTLMTTALLAPGATLAQMQAEVAGRWEDVRSAHPAETRDWTVRVRSTEDSLLNDNARAVLVLLGIVVSLVLLIACANVANLLLARGAGREGEMAVRSALGAGRGGLVRQLLVESLILSVAATLLGLVGSDRLLAFLQNLTEGADSLFFLAEIDTTVLAFTGVVALLAPLVFGLYPALRASRADVADQLRRAGGSVGRPGRVRSLLVGGQVALAMVALVVGGLLVRSVVGLQSLDSNYRQEGILTASLLRPVAAQPGDGFFVDLLERLPEAPGIRAAALASELPRSPASGQLVEVAGDDAMEERRQALVTAVTPGYFDLLDIDVVQGRTFLRTDGAASLPVAVVSRAAAAAYWSDGPAVGARLRLDGDPTWVEVVGVVADVRLNQQGVGIPQIYRPLSQEPHRTSMTLVADVAGPPAAYAAAVRAVVSRLDPAQPVSDILSLEASVFRSNAAGYGVITLFLIFAGFALVMATAGIYGVVSFSVTARIPEFGVRMALGAPPARVRRMVLRQGTGVVVGGTLVGLVGAYWASGLAQGMLVGVGARDPLTYGGVAALLVGVTLAASWLPARRATRIDPVRALRAE